MGIIFPVIFFEIHFDEGTDLQQKQQLKVCWLCELNDMKNNLAEGLCHSKAYSVYGTLTKRNHEILCDPRRKLRLNVAALLMYYACTKRIYNIRCLIGFIFILFDFFASLPSDKGAWELATNRNV